MKKLEKLQNKKLKSIFYVFGGGVVTTSDSFKTSDGCVHTITDSYNDKNGNGSPDWGENYTQTEQVKCPSLSIN